SGTKRLRAASANRQQSHGTAPANVSTGLRDQAPLRFSSAAQNAATDSETTTPASTIAWGVVTKHRIHQPFLAVPTWRRNGRCLRY
ncbi:hypothetical protein, partial [Klebsiella pneumoniae]|uniref:hypothetical protein n=1 Tax=Klebsiella pneumoniae TaxID=573 RepID=UPI0027312FD2